MQGSMKVLSPCFQALVNCSDAPKRKSMQHTMLKARPSEYAADWAGAMEAFTNAGDYEDSITQITETKYQQAKSLMDAKDYSWRTHHLYYHS